MELSYLMDMIGMPEAAKAGIMEIYESLDFSPYREACEIMTASYDSHAKGYEALRAAIGDKNDEHERLTLTLELVIALTTYENYKRIGIPDKIFFETMGVFTRYAEMYEKKYGSKIRTMNPESCEINDLVNCHAFDGVGKESFLNEWI